MKYYLIKYDKDNAYSTWQIPQTPLEQLRAGKDVNKPNTTVNDTTTAEQFYSKLSANKKLHIICEADTYQNLLEQISLTYPELLI